MYKNGVKIVFDFLAAAVGLLVLSPLFILLFIALFFANKGYPFFYQIRPGKNERLFKIIKFRTMNVKTDLDGNLLSDAKRLTKLGKLVRKSSLDEIPQLINVIKGDMSLVGPRPLLPEYLPLYNDDQKKRHLVKPGITGWAQVNGRNEISWDKKLALDVWYVANQTFTLDLKIIFKTLIKVLTKEGISKDGEATTTPFKGS
jgi:lipopolysaccharide/colanic/teichoic acid biosynthesis glycosyltransferase